MAINFLDNLDLNDNQLLNARLQNLASDPGSANAGDIIFNTSSNVFKFYNGSAWIDPSAGSYIDWRYQADSGLAQIVQTGNTVDFSGGTGITTTAGTGTLSIALDNISGVVGSYTLANITVDAQGRITSAASGTAGGMTSWDITVPGSTDTVTNGQAVTLSNVTASGESLVITRQSARTYLLGAKYTAGSSNGGTGSANIITAAGAGSTWNGSGLFLATNGTSTGGASAAAQRWSIANFPITRWGNPTTNLNMNTNKIINVVDPTAAQDAATKNYVDTNIVGNLVFQGGYNAATNTPDLDSSPSASIKKGWAYVVTTAGSFFTETVEVGDFLFAQSDAPTTLADWVTVQNNIGLATLTNVGIGNVIPSALNDQLGISVVYNGSGTASLGLDIDGLTESGGVGSTAQADDLLVFQDVSTTPNKNYKITVANLATAIGASGSAFATGSGSATYFVSHNFGTRNVMVEVYETASPYQTVYGTVTRPNLNQVKIEFGAVTGSLTFMCRKL